MARRKFNKSAAIREALQANPAATVSQVVEMLAAQKIKVTPQLVSNVKARSEPKSTSKRRRGRPAKANLSLEQLMAASEFAKAMGGLDQATIALETLNRLR